jgi:gluconolactonase
MERIQAHRFIDVAPHQPARQDPPGFDRRAFLKAAAGLAAVCGMSQVAFARQFGPQAEPIRYPEPDVVVLDKRFTYKVGNTTIMRLYTGTLWAEGPAWNAVGRYLVWSDIPRNEQLRYNEEDDHVGRRFRYPSNYSNGNTFDFQGRQISCEHFTRQVARYEWDGTRTVLAEKHDGKEFNAPNDVVVHPHDGGIWFTDPGYGSLFAYEGNLINPGNPQPIRKEAIYRIDAQTGKIDMVTDEMWKPNGLCFSPDYKKLYVADTGASHYSEQGAIRNITAFDVVDGRSLRNKRMLCDTKLGDKTGGYDGIRCDTDGNIWAGAGWAGDGYDGVHCIAPDGTKIGQIRLPEICSNVAFGGHRGIRLFMTASQSLYAVYLKVQGAHIT